MTPAAVRYAALLRGVNVGRARRVAMADLRTTVESLGHRAVRTLLNSGNVVFSGRRADPAALAAALHAALRNRTGVSAPVIVVPAAMMDLVVDEAPFAGSGIDPARLLVAFVRNPSHLDVLAPLARESHGADALHVGPHAAYLSFPDGILASPLGTAVNRALGDDVTTRNWTTVTRLQALLRQG